MGNKRFFPTWLACMMVSENAKTYSGMMFLAKAARTKAIVHMTQFRVEMVNYACAKKCF